MENCNTAFILGYEKLISSLTEVEKLCLIEDRIKIKQFIIKYKSLLSHSKSSNTNIIPTDKETILVRTNLYRILSHRYAGSPSYGYGNYPGKDDYKSYDDYCIAVETYNKIAIEKERFLEELRLRIYNTDIMDLVQMRVNISYRIKERYDKDIELYNNDNNYNRRIPKPRTDLEKEAINTINIALIEKFESINAKWLKSNKFLNYKK